MAAAARRGAPRFAGSPGPCPAPYPWPPPRTQGVPFRETHHISGAAVKMAEDRGCTLSDLAPGDLRSIHPLFDDDVVKV